MRVSLLTTCGLLLLAGCTKEKPATSIQETTRDVTAVPDVEVTFDDLPKEPEKPRTFGDDALPEPKVLPKVTPRLTLEPSGMTTATELREVKVAVDLEGVDPSDLVVEFTAPEGHVFNRQETRLTETRYHRQLAEFLMPVSGTTITAARMYGTWHAHVFLAGEKVAILPFEVLP